MTIRITGACGLECSATPKIPTSRAVSGADESDVASHQPRVGVGRHRADGSIAHLMAWNWSEPGRATEDRSCVIVNPGLVAARNSDELSCRRRAMSAAEEFIQTLSRRTTNTAA